MMSLGQSWTGRRAGHVLSAAVGRRSLATRHSTMPCRSTEKVLSNGELRAWRRVVLNSESLLRGSVAMAATVMARHLSTTSCHHSGPAKVFNFPVSTPSKNCGTSILARRMALDLISGLDATRALTRSSSRQFSSGSPRGDKDGRESGGGKGDKAPDDEELMQSKRKLAAALAMAVAFSFFLFLSDSGGGGRREEISRANQVTWNDFYHEMLLKGEVEEVIISPQAGMARVLLHRDAIYKGQRVRNPVFRINKLPDDVELKIRDTEAELGISPGAGIAISYERRSEAAAAFLAALFVVAVFAVFVGSVRYLSKNMQLQMQNPVKGLTRAAYTLIDPQIKAGKGVKFSDVAGLKEAKIEVREFVDYLKNPMKYKELGAKPPKGAILFGPPGCGKTMLAKAVANESNVPFLSMNGSEFIEMIGGLGAARVRSLFEDARKKAPSIVYIDEIDAIGRKRAGTGGGRGQTLSTGESEQTLNQLLVEMDGMASKDGVIMLASTNRSDVLDKALLRPGRFDRHIMIDLPTLVERKEILQQHMKGVVFEDNMDDMAGRLATLTPGFSGADLANVINEGALHAARMKNEKVGRANLEYAIERVIAGPAKKTSTLNPVERRVVAFHESGHALVGWLLPHTDALLKVTILPRTSAALGFAQYTPTEKKLYSPEEMFDRMCMALGGRVAEALTFNRITTGAQNDLEKVTKMAYSQIKQFGFNETVGLVSFDESESSVRPYSNKLQATMDLEARKLVAEAYQKTEQVLKDNADQLAAMATALLERETLNYDDVEALLGPPPHGKKNLVSPADFERQIAEQSAVGGGSGKPGPAPKQAGGDTGRDNVLVELFSRFRPRWSHE